MEREKRERREIEAELAQFREIITAGRWEEALAAIEQGLVKRPDEPEFIEERDRVRRLIAGARDRRERQEVEGELGRSAPSAARAGGGCAGRDRAGAGASTRSAGVHRRARPGASWNGGGAGTARPAGDRSGGRAVPRAVRGGTVERALAAIERALGRRPNQPEFLEERAAVRRGMAGAREQSERQAMEAELTQIRRLNEDSRYQEALDAAGTALARRPNHPQLTEDGRRHSAAWPPCARSWNATRSMWSWSRSGRSARRESGTKRWRQSN